MSLHRVLTVKINAAGEYEGWAIRATNGPAAIYASGDPHVGRMLLSWSPLLSSAEIFSSLECAKEAAEDVCIDDGWTVQVVKVTLVVKVEEA